MAVIESLDLQRPEFRLPLPRMMLRRPESMPSCSSSPCRSLTTLKEKLIKIGAKVVSHGRYVIFQMAEVAIARQMFQEILRLIAELRPQPPSALA